MASKKTRQLSIGELAKLQSIFVEKKWKSEIDDDFFGDNKFELFCEMLLDHNEEERNLILDLTKNFLWVKDSEYIRIFSNVLDSFIRNYNFGSLKNIVFCPLIQEEYFGKSKSSIALLYKIKSSLVQVKRKYSNYNFICKDLPLNINISSASEMSVLCLIDDFIGTGQTAVNAIKFFIDREFPKEQIVILSLVGMEAGIAHLQNLGYNVFTYYVEKKGITGSGKNENERIQLMRLIEQEIGVCQKYDLGFEHSEALVAMARTPNNTFPIYWYINKKLMKNIHAPFPR